MLVNDTFNRTNNTNLNADDTGKSGSLAHVSWNVVSHKGSPEIVSNQLQLGESSAAGGWSIAWINHNFTDSQIYNSGEFTVSVDLINLGSTTELKIYLGGIQDYQQTINLGLEANISVKFHSFSNFNSGTNVNYEASVNDSIVKTGVFSWSDTSQNYINLYSNYTFNTARFDNFEVSSVPEPSIYALFIGVSTLGYAFCRRRK